MTLAEVRFFRDMAAEAPIMVSSLSRHFTEWLYKMDKVFYIRATCEGFHVVAD
jgi:hypothetical protein